jgi:hypothetical protein
LGAGLVLWGALGLAILPATEQTLDLKPDPKETEKAKEAFPPFKLIDSDKSDSSVER